LLLVEDEVKLSAALEEGLMRAQYTVDVALDGREGIELAQGASYDVIVLDIMLPIIDGLEICRRLRSSGDRTPVLMLTARDTVGDRVAGLDTGADDYLVKPFAFAELLARLRALLRRDAPSKEGVLHLTELTLDPAAQRVRWGGQPVDLTSREYRILEALMRRPGWVLTRDALIESIWGFDFPETSNVIEVYVGRIRRKLADHGAPALIQTVRGSGYRIQEPEA
jgi:DNA-binding response OmpR family regulator